MSPLVKVPLRYGAIAGLLGAVLVAGLYYMGTHPFLIPIYFDFRIFLFGVFIFFSLRELRDLHFNRILHFWQGVIASFLFVTAYAVLASSGVGLFAWMVPDFVRSYISLTTEQVRSLPPEVIARIGKEVYERNLAMLPSTNVKDLVALYFIQCFLIGLFISIILSVILRRQPKP